MSDDDIHIQRPRQFNFLGLAIFMIVVVSVLIGGRVLLLSNVHQFKTDPPGATVKLNGEVICASTPCKANSSRFLRRTFEINKPDYLPLKINVPQFAQGPDLLRGAVITLPKDQALAACYDERAKLDVKGDIDTSPCYRKPPIMPYLARRSGHCIMTFDVSKKGIPENIQIKKCTAKYFGAPSVEAITSWRYLPALQDGIAVARKDVETRISYRLRDEKGELIPETADEN